MRLRWWKKKPDHECEITLESAPQAHPEEAQKALEEIQAERKIIEERQPFVDNLSRALARHYNENNFSRLIEDAMRRRSR